MVRWFCMLAIASQIYTCYAHDYLYFMPIFLLRNLTKYFDMCALFRNANLTDCHSIDIICNCSFVQLRFTYFQEKFYADAIQVSTRIFAKL